MESLKSALTNDTIAAIATPYGIGGIAVIRVSGPESIDIINSAWNGTDLTTARSHTSHYGDYYSVDGSILDSGLATVFIAPHSFTGENTVEISIHGSLWIQREIMHDIIRRGVRMADPGEFTRRAFSNGKIDLAQAEGIADLISSSSKAAHDMAINQTRGSFSKGLSLLREKLIEFASLLELELDFTEEDVEFADRTSLISLCREVIDKINKLKSSYSQGAVLKDGVPVVIAGKPNSGKSSLLNLLLNDDKAIVTDIPGTTRDIIEDAIELDGILYRFIDTAGLRETADIVEEIGVKKALDAIEKAFIILWVIDSTTSIKNQMEELEKFYKNHPEKKIIPILNKTDINPSPVYKFNDNLQAINFSTVSKAGHQELLSRLKEEAYGDSNPTSDLIVTNARHYEALCKSSESLGMALKALESGISADFIAQDIREALHHLSLLTGEITTDNLLSSIFSRFCVGK